MTAAEYARVREALRESVHAFPRCRIANCLCDERGGEWRAGCACFGHFRDMDGLYGEDRWTLSDFERQSRAGRT